MKKQTTRQRIEQAVERALLFAAGNRKELPLGEIEYLMRQEILAERRRIRRGVKKQQQYAIAMSNDSEWWDGYIAATRNILALWEG